MKNEKFIQHQLEKLGYWHDIYSQPNYFGEGATKLALMAFQTFNKNGIKNILELGCGQGRDATYFAEKGFNILATDFSQDAIDFVNKISKKNNLNSLSTLKFDILDDFSFDRKFDCVYSNLALQFFNKQELEGIFQKISSILETDQYFIFSTKKPGDKYHNVGEKITEDSFRSRGITRYFFPEAILASLVKEFFEIESFGSETHVNPDNSVSAWWHFTTRKK